jgi:hypothetical protein
MLEKYEFKLSPKPGVVNDCTLIINSAMDFKGVQINAKV